MKNGVFMNRELKRNLTIAGIISAMLILALAMMLIANRNTRTENVSINEEAKSKDMIGQMLFDHNPYHFTLRANEQGYVLSSNNNEEGFQILKGDLKVGEIVFMYESDARANEQVRALLASADEKNVNQDMEEYYIKGENDDATYVELIKSKNVFAIVGVKYEDKSYETLKDIVKLLNFNTGVN